MKISALIPAFNRRATLPRAIESVLEQRSEVDEIIVVDDGSSDGSAALIRRDYPQVVLIEQDNRGVSAARNRGIEAARGNWLALLDSDDAWLPEKIERLREEHRAHPDYVLYHSDEIWIRDGRRVNPMKKHRKRGGWIFRHCLPLCVISPSSAVIKKQTLQQLGGFDESLPACEDYDLWLRLCHRFPVRFIDQPLLTRYAGHDDQLSACYPAMDRFRVRALDRLLRQHPLDEAQQQLARETLLQKLTILLNGARKHHNQAILDEFEPMHQRWLATESMPC